MTEAEKVKEPIKADMSWVDFLQYHPPGSSVNVSGALVYGQPPTHQYLFHPEIKLYCGSDECKKEMNFDPNDSSGPYLSDKHYKNSYVEYRCRNCKETLKMFSICVQAIDLTARICTAYKYGEYPTFGPYTPPRVLEIIGPDGHLYFKGRQCESQGLGIGAYAYYRRVIDNQWSRLIDEIYKVAKKIGSPNEIINALEQAKKETQFQKAVDDLKDAIPPVLMINGQNPISLLYWALSDGIHNLSDEECLERATSIRHVLADLAERLSTALKHEKGLADAVSHLAKIKSQKAQKADNSSSGTGS